MEINHLKVLSLCDRCSFEISSTILSNATVRQLSLIIWCFNSAILLLVYWSSHFMRKSGISFSGSLERIENITSSIRLVQRWKNSFNRLGFFISISMIINSLQIFLKKFLLSVENFK